jgi:hypothetical protein
MTEMSWHLEAIMSVTFVESTTYHCFEGAGLLTPDDKLDQEADETCCMPGTTR